MLPHEILYIVTVIYSTVNFRRGIPTKINNGIFLVYGIIENTRVLLWWKCLRLYHRLPKNTDSVQEQERNTVYMYIHVHVHGHRNMSRV